MSRRLVTAWQTRTMPERFTRSPVLIVDDVPANVIAAEAVLASLARPIVTATSGEEALARLLEHEIGLVLLDVNMPGMDGIEVAQLIRARERTQHVPIIFVTAFDHDDSTVLRAYKLGAVDFLFKPVAPDVLTAKAAALLTLQDRTEQIVRERDRREESFLATLSHELRNPLAALRSAVDVIRMQPTAPVPPRVLGALHRQTTTLTRLVTDLLDVARYRVDKLELRPEAVDLVDLVEDALAASRPIVDERGHALVFDAPSTRISVNVDPVRVTQVLCNLLDNAACFTQPGGHIEVTCAASDGFAVVRVADNGMGIAPELQPTIFDMFVQERVRSDGSGGLGIGLALSRRLVEMHRGTICVRSAGHGHGSTFEVMLPLADSPLALTVHEPRD